MNEKTEDKETVPAILIKKYANRRLYHTERSTYVTLDDLSEMVKEGTDFVVQDAKSGEDITRGVLTQIIFDAENKGQTMLPTPFLREIIRLYGDSMQGFVPNYLENAMSNFITHQEKVREGFEASLARNPAMMGFETLQKMNAEWMERSMQMFGAAVPAQAATVGKASSAHDDVDALREEFRQMQEKLSKLTDG